MPNTGLKRILYVEDDEGLARLLQKRLERQSFLVDTTISAEEAIQRLEQQRYDMVLLDYHLPGMNGLEALDIMMQLPKAPPVILLTASGDESVAVAALEKGATDYAVKDTGQNYFDLLPAIMQAAYTRETLQRENDLQRQELEMAKERAENANNAKSNFLATMSHEIRTPLNVVTGLTAVLARTKLDAEQTKIVDILRSNADLLLKLINDLLDISRIEGGHVQLEAAGFELSSVLQDIRFMFEEQARRKNISFNLTDITEGRRYIGDRTRVQQIVMNLVSNAIKFTDHGEVKVTTAIVQKNHKPYVEIAVHDSGIGIAPEHLPMIFNKFTQADETITRRYGGSGLGLSIAYSLTTIMDGNITVQSVPGRGSIFTVTLCLPPCASAKEERPSPSLSTASTPPAGGMILLVEDYAPNIMVATMMLEDMGYEVMAVDSGAKALSTIAEQQKPFAAILMDVQMQDMDGLETTRRIRELEIRKGFRHAIIGVTAHALAGDRERCLAAGMDDYVSKPIHADILATKLRELTKIPACHP